MRSSLVQDVWRVAEFNALPTEKAFVQALHFCGSESWAESMVAGRPFGDAGARRCQRLWAAATRQDRREAFAAHRLLEISPSAAEICDCARSEQGQVMAADEQVLAGVNQAYFDRHGFIFIIFATGKGAAQMLAADHALITQQRMRSKTRAQNKLK